MCPQPFPNPSSRPSHAGVTGTIPPPASHILLLIVGLLALMPIWALRASAAADDDSALINEAMDKQVDFSVNAVLPSAIRSIEDKTGVPIRVDAMVWDLLPWGEQTNITATVKNQTLRQALGAIAQKLGLTYRLDDHAIVLEPMPALRRLGKRATVQELQALDLLASKSMPAATGWQKVQDVLTAIDAQLAAIHSSFAVENRIPPDLRNAQVNIPRNATMLDALEEIVKQTRATWYPWGKSLVVIPKETMVRDQLSRPITARYNGEDLAQVLEDLRKRAGVDFTIEPGALQRVPLEYRKIKILWDNVPVSQALESLKASTGLDYQVTDNGVTITGPTSASTAAGSGNPDPVAAMVPLENGMTLFIRNSQIPSDLQPYLRHRVQKEMETLRQMAAQEGYPLTQPTTQPASASAAKEPPR